MKIRNLKAYFSLFLAIMMIFSVSSIAYAWEPNTEEETYQFGDILYSDNGVTVFYGNPHENEEAANAIEEQAARSLRHDQVWVNAYTSRDNEVITIPASSSNPITYYTIRQETTSPLVSSTVFVFRPDGTTCFIWNMNTSTQEIADKVVGTNVLPNKAYKWTSGSLKLRWKVQTGSSGARMNLWAW